MAPSQPHRFFEQADLEFFCFQIFLFAKGQPAEKNLSKRKTWGELKSALNPAKKPVPAIHPGGHAPDLSKRDGFDFICGYMHGAWRFSFAI
ncbi:MAG: hypothetical protein KKH41_05250 [Candidatus Thermoplasmatota archaeon]|nr:hypothetical protein [Euryarchaeota archaeon]MBU4031267.1 hypothetical protein [Candidatus Thermoplasmatota archaeon]MBU4143514.1 hypothetical protein [Candidatus Thermoplasmatota archaeon]MBU4591974.1 hypothetical protein [Candidatus Thermoplasmatota archaeon]